MTPNVTEQTWADDDTNALISVSPDGLVVRCNAAARAMFGSNGLPPVGQPVQSLVAERIPEDPDVALQQAKLVHEQLLRRIAHDLCNPLNSIIGFTGTLLMKLPGPLNGEQENQLRIVQSSARHMLTQINAMLAPREGEAPTSPEHLSEE